jgi:hypothetical protein
MEIGLGIIAAPFHKRRAGRGSFGESQNQKITFPPRKHQIQGKLNPPSLFELRWAGCPPSTDLKRA